MCCFSPKLGMTRTQYVSTDYALKDFKSLIVRDHACAPTLWWQIMVALLLQLRSVFVCQWPILAINHLRSNCHPCVLFLVHHRSSRRPTSVAISTTLFFHWDVERTWSPRYVRQVYIADRWCWHPAWAIDWFRNHLVYWYTGCVWSRSLFDVSYSQPWWSVGCHRVPYWHATVACELHRRWSVGSQSA